MKVESANRAAYVRTNLPKWTREVQVNQNSVVGWLDTGCTKSMIHPRFINKDDYLGWKIPYTTASAKKVWFPAARITLNIDNNTYQLAVGVSSHLTVDMLLGQDVPKFRKLLKEALRERSNPRLEEQMRTSESVMVVTRAGKKKQELAQSQSELYQERDEAVIHEVESGSEQGLGQIFDFDSDVFIVPTQTTHHRSTVASQIQLERISPSQMRSHQLSDSTLEEWRRQADTGGEGDFCWREGLLHKKPYAKGGANLLVIPTCYRNEVLKLAHSSPAAGHFAEARTLDTLRQRVTWLRITSDVKEACRSCPTCQRSAPTTMKTAPLHSLPIIRTPFERVAMDIFGPLKRTKSGYKYLLVIMDYATKWPEAFPLRNVTTESVVECLIELTARLGVPKEVLTDNGTNFVSRTMKKFCALAGIQ